MGVGLIKGGMALGPPAFLSGGGGRKSRNIIGKCMFFLFGNADFNLDCEVHGHCYGSIAGNK